MRSEQFGKTRAARRVRSARRRLAYAGQEGGAGGMPICQCTDGRDGGGKATMGAVRLPTQAGSHKFCGDNEISFSCKPTILHSPHTSAK